MSEMRREADQHLAVQNRLDRRQAYSNDNCPRTGDISALKTDGKWRHQSGRHWLALGSQ